MRIETFVLSPFQQNTRLVVCEETRTAICIDPGADCDEIVEFINENHLQLQAITLTHGHLDHVGGTKFLKDAFPETEVILHKDDEALYKNLPREPLKYGIPAAALKQLGFATEEPPQISRYWQHSENYAVGNLNFTILHCPGHTPGHVVIAEKNEKKVFVGDCLFEGSIGRTDLPGGNYEQLIESINTNILSLGDDFIVYSGHGSETSVGKEKATNPFLNGNVARGRFL